MTATDTTATDVVRDELQRVAAVDRLLVALDFDGTLAPRADDPMSARMVPEARAALSALSALPGTWVALVSGRSLADLRVIAEHDDDSAILLAGSHGAEYWLPGEGAVEPIDDDADVALRDRLRAEAEEAVADLPGAWIEPKTFGFAVHTRLSSAEDGARAQADVDALVAAHAPEWRRRTGYDIVEYAFRHEGKDTGVARLRAHVGADAVVYAGDDVTDEDALETLGADDLGIRVGDGETAARVRVADVDALADALALLSRLRAASRE